MRIQTEQDYLERGYRVFPTGLGTRLRTLRRKIITLFDKAASSNGLSRIKSDADIWALYDGGHRDLWVGVYDQLPFLPEVMGLANNRELLRIARRCGIRWPALAGLGTAVLANMPHDDPYLYVPHQDITYNSGSLNSITIWVPLQDVPESAGPLEFVAGSHQRGIIEAPKWLSRRHFSESDLAASKIGKLYKDSDYVSVPLEVSQVVAFSQFLVHRSGMNRGEAIRFTLQYRFRDLASKEYATRNFSLESFTEESGAQFSQNA